MDQHDAMLARLPESRERLRTELQLLPRTSLDDLIHVDSRNVLLPLNAEHTVPNSPAQPTKTPILINQDRMRTAAAPRKGPAAGVAASGAVGAGAVRRTAAVSPARLLRLLALLSGRLLRLLLPALLVRLLALGVPTVRIGGAAAVCAPGSSLTS